MDHHMAKKQETQKPPEGVLVAAARSIGTAAGTLAAAVGVAAPQKIRVAKLPDRKKSRLPRRQKKAVKKAAARAQGAAKVKAAR